MENIFLAIPVLESMPAKMVYSLLGMFDYWRANPVFNLQYSMIIGSRQIHFARNGLVRQGLKQKADYILFIDADMKFPADIMHRLFFASKDICGVLYRGRISPHPYNVFYQDEKKDMIQVPKNWKPTSKIQEVDGVGTGIMLIRRKVFDELPKPYFFYKADKSEDIMFCHKAREHGFKVYVETEVVVKHLGEAEF